MICIFACQRNLKGSVSRDFYLYFFHDSNPSGSLINRLKLFRIIYRFPRDVQIFKKLCGVSHTTESVYVVSIKPQSQTPWYASHCRVKIAKYFFLTPWCASHCSASICRVKLCGVHHTAESDSAVCITPQSQDSKISFFKLRGVHPMAVRRSAESSSAVCIIPLSQTPQCASYRRV